MPIEIKEIHISVAVDGGGPQPGGGGQGMDRIKMVSECVEMVMEIIKDQKER
jgi:hypothetical protein